MTKAAAEEILLQKTVPGWLVGSEASWRWHAERGALEITISGTMDMDWSMLGNGSHQTTLAAAGFYPPERRVRPARQDAAVPWANDIASYVCRATTTILPRPAAGRFWDHDTAAVMQTVGGIDYWRVGTIRDGAVRTIQSTRTVKAEISPAEAEIANGQIKTFNNSTSTVYEETFKPAKMLHTKSPKITDVPSATDIDWLSDDAPCKAPSN